MENALLSQKSSAKSVFITLFMTTLSDYSQNNSDIYDKLFYFQSLFFSFSRKCLPIGVRLFTGMD